MSGRWPGWSHLPPELLLVIVQDHLTSAIDIARLRCVCASWRSAVPAVPIPPQLPWLLLPYRRKSQSLSFFTPSDQNLHTVTLPNSNWDSVFASSHGYLLLLQESPNPLEGISVSLFNPINKHLIPFPSLPPELNSPLPPELRSSFIEKAVIGLNPAPLVAVWIDMKFAFCILDKPDWRVFDVKYPYVQDQCDLAYHNGYFYLASKASVQVFNLKLSKKMSRSQRLSLPFHSISSLHFVVSSGILLLLVRSFSRSLFTVYRVDRSSKGVWHLVRKELGGDDLFFVSHKNSACVPAGGVLGWEERRACYASEEIVEGMVAPEIRLMMGVNDGFSLQWWRDRYYWHAPREHWAYWKDVNRGMGITWFLPKLH